MVGQIHVQKSSLPACSQVEHAVSQVEHVPPVSTLRMALRRLPLHILTKFGEFIPNRFDSSKMAHFT